MSTSAGIHPTTIMSPKPYQSSMTGRVQTDPHLLFLQRGFVGLPLPRPNSYALALHPVVSLPSSASLGLISSAMAQEFSEFVMDLKEAGAPFFTMAFASSTSRSSLVSESLRNFRLLNAE